MPMWLQMTKMMKMKVSDGGHETTDDESDDSNLSFPWGLYPAGDGKLLNLIAGSYVDYVVYMLVSKSLIFCALCFYK